MVLHADELGPAVLFGDVLHRLELEGPHAAGADVAHLTALHEVVQRLHGFRDGHGVVEAVDLEEIYIVGLQAGQRGVDRVEYCCAREAPLVNVIFGCLDLREAGELGHV